MKNRGGIREQIRRAPHWPLDKDVALLTYTRKDDYQLDPYVSYDKIMLTVTRWHDSALLMIKYYLAFDQRLGILTWKPSRAGTAFYDLTRTERFGPQDFQIDFYTDRVGAETIAWTSRFFNAGLHLGQPVHYSPPFGEVYFAYNETALPVQEHSSALLLAARRLFRKKVSESVSSEELAQTWQRSCVEIDGLLCWPQSFLVRNPSRRYESRLGEQAPSVFDGVPEGARLGNWNFIDSGWIPNCQRPVRVYVKTAGLTGFPCVNTSFEVLQAYGAIDADVSRDAWMANATDDVVANMLTALEDAPRETVYSMMEDVAAGVKARIQFTEFDLGEAICDPRKPLFASRLPVPHILAIPNGFTPESATWESAGVVFRLADSMTSVNEALAKSRIPASSARVFGRATACVGRS